MRVFVIPFTAPVYTLEIMLIQDYMIGRIHGSIPLSILNLIEGELENWLFEPAALRDLDQSDSTPEGNWIYFSHA